MNGDLGPQYSGDDAFKASARLHQSRFRATELSISACREYGNRLATVDALAGRNFYDWPGMLEAVEDRFGRTDTPLWSDMLRSEHIPFNFFVPLRRELWARRLFAEWLGREVAEVTRIAIEWAPEPRVDYLDDNTSFDTYVECVLGDGQRAALGIEVKYTEGAYAWGKTERKRMFDPDSIYHQVHRRAELYVNDALEALRTRRLKQLWRNQLLGTTLLQSPDAGFAQFASVLLYPAGNIHYAAASREYLALIRPSSQRAFVAMTFEDFIASCRRFVANSDAALAWLDYLDRRYLIDAAHSLGSSG